MIEQFKSVLFWALLLGSTLYLMSEPANSKPQPEYVAGLEKIVAKCLSDATGRPLKIGDDWYLCGITHIGRFP